MAAVFLHPIGLDGHCWDLMPIGGVRLDLAGHGRRRPLTEEVTLTALAEDVIEQLSPEDGPHDLVGLSLGGAVAQHVTLLRPDLVRSLVIVCSSAATNQDALMARASDAEASGMPGVLASTMSRWFSESVLNDPGHQGVRYARRRLLEHDKDVFAATWRALARHDVRSALPSITVPVTAVAARQDQASKRENLEAIAEGVVDGRVVDVDGPHMVQLENPDGLADVVNGHLAAVVPS